MSNESTGPNLPKKASQLRNGPLAAVLQQCRRAFVFVFILTFIAETLSVAPILYMMNMFDRVLSSRSAITLVSLTVLVVAVYIFWSAMEWIRTRLMIRIAMRIDWELAASAFDASFRRYVGRKKVNVHQVLGDLVQVRQFLTGSSILALMSAPFAVVFIVIGAFFHPYLAVFSLVASLILLVTAYLNQKVTTPVLRAANESAAESSRLANQNLRLAESALALGMQRNIRQRWYSRHQGALELQVNASEATGLVGGISGVLSKAFPSLQMALGAYLAIEGLITGGMVIAATFLISKAIQPIQKVLSSWKDISNSRQAYERLDQLLAEDEKNQNRMELPPPTGRLDVVDLIMQHTGSQKVVLAGIKFSLSPGEVLAVVGASGAGKTSLTKLLVGILPPTRGSVRLDGAEISEWAHDNLGRYMGYVPQDIDFFEGTVAENIARLGEIDPQKVVKASQMVDFHETILKFPRGYETPLGETGHVLTGGQKQRLAIVRAIYGDPSYVVMDEPNSSLDETGELALIKTIQTLKDAGTTVIVSTHRPSLIAVADKLLILKDGKQTVFGTVADLISSIRMRQETSAETPVVEHSANAMIAARQKDLSGTA